jgi:hypothetical protein
MHPVAFRLIMVTASATAVARYNVRRWSIKRTIVKPSLPAGDGKALPYPGFDAFDEDSAGIFFGREADVMGGIRDLRQIRHRGSPRLLVIQATSGAGKSSFLKAGLWPRLGRTALAHDKRLQRGLSFLAY